MTALKATTASKPRRRAVTVAALAAGAVLALSGCGAGQVSQTATQVAAVNGNSANVGSIALRDVRFLLPQTEEYNNTKGGKAVLAFSAINLSDSKTDELVAINTDLGQVKLADKVELKPSSTVVANLPTAKDAAGAAAVHDQNEGQPVGDKATDPALKPILIEVTGLTKDVTPGLTYPVTFVFKQAAETVLVNVPVDAGANNPRQEPAKQEHKGGE
ncbi:hypothetical protein [Nocardia heshunensis]